MPDPASESRTSRSAPVGAFDAVAVGMLVLAGAWLFRWLPADQILLTQDLARDVLAARGCDLARSCGDQVVSTSFQGIPQGRLWILALAVLDRIDFPLTWLPVLLTLGSTLSAVWMYLAVRSRGRWPALMTAALVLVAFPWLANRIFLWNPALLPLPAVAAWFATSRAVRRDGALRWLLAGVTVGCLAETHRVAGLGLLPLGFVAGRFAKRPGTMAILAAIGFVAPVVAGSYGALGTVPTDLLATPIASATLGFAATWGLGLLARAASRRGGDDSSNRDLTTAAVTGGGYVILLLALSWGLAHPLRGDYLLPAVPAGAFGLALGLARLWGCRKTAGPHRAHAVGRSLAGWLAIGVLLLGAHRLMPSFPQAPGKAPAFWTVQRAARIANRLESRGWSWPSLVASLRGPGAPRFLSAMAVFLPDTSTGDTGRTALQWAFRWRGEASAPDTPSDPRWHRLDDDFDLLLWEFDAITTSDAIEVCLYEDAATTAFACDTFDVRATALRTAHALLARGYPMLDAPARLQEAHLAASRSSNTLTLRYRIPMSLPPGPVDRVLTLCPGEGLWRIEAIQGPTATIADDGLSARVQDDGPLLGTLEVRRQWQGRAQPGRSWPPGIAELDPEDPAAFHLTGCWRD